MPNQNLASALQPPVDPQLAAFMQQNNLKDPSIAKLAMEYRKSVPPSPQSQPQTPQPAPGPLGSLPSQVPVPLAQALRKKL